MPTFLAPSDARSTPAIALGALVALMLAAAGCGGGGSDGHAAKRTSVALGDPIIAKGAMGHHRVEVVVEAEEGAAADLADFDLSASEKKMTPWYVRTKLENTGDEVSVKDPVPVLVTPEDDAGLEAKKIGLLGDFPRCKLVNPPDPFPAGAKNESCSVFLVRPGNTLSKIVYEETRFEGANRVYDWKVG